MTPQSFDFITKHIREKSGISLTSDKTYLLESRLQPVARQHGFDDINAMISALQVQMNPAVLHDIIQSMTTNETMFFRDNKPFERLENIILPYIKEHVPTRKDIRIWSAASSTGQEAYTIALCLQQQAAKYPGYDFSIFGSDLCEDAVARAKAGTYSQFEVQRGMPIQMLVQFFNQQEGNQWQLKDEIRQKVSFQTHNLLHSPATFGKFDVIFCRNVLIYFDEDVKRQVMTNLTSTLRSPGFVVLGSAESPIGIADNLEMVEGAAGVYRLK